VRHSLWSIPGVWQDRLVRCRTSHPEPLSR
jgi:hypothetical protein